MRDKINPELLKAIRASLQADTRTAANIGALIGCSPALVTQVKNGNRMPGSFVLDFCRVLGLNPYTGKPRSKKIIKGKVKTGKRNAVLSQHQESIEQFANIEVTTRELPDEIDLSEEEAEAILSARENRMTPEEMRVYLVAIDKNPAVAQAVEEILKGNYIDAASICLALSRNHHPRP